MRGGFPPSPAEEEEEEQERADKQDMKGHGAVTGRAEVANRPCSGGAAVAKGAIR